MGTNFNVAVKNRNCFYSQRLSVKGRKLTKLQRKTIRWHLCQRISSVQRRTVNGDLDHRVHRLSVWTSPCRRQRKAIRRHFVNVSLPSNGERWTVTSITRGHRLSVWTSPCRRQRKAIRRHFVNVSLPSTWTSPSKSGRLDVSVCCINRPLGYVKELFEEI